jgi:hypothetical protein
MLVPRARQRRAARNNVSDGAAPAMPSDQHLAVASNEDSHNCLPDPDSAELAVPRRIRGLAYDVGLAPALGELRFIFKEFFTTSSVSWTCLPLPGNLLKWHPSVRCGGESVRPFYFLRCVCWSSD